jgi:hypothetical protein
MCSGGGRPISTHSQASLCVSVRMRVRRFESSRLRAAGGHASGRGVLRRSVRRAAHLLAWAWERQELQLLVNCSTKLYFPPWKASPIAKMHPLRRCGWSQRERAARSLLRRRRSGCPSKRGRPGLLTSPTNAALISRHKGTAAGRQTACPGVFK